VNVLKLGGSVITEKDEPETVDDERLAALAASIGDAGSGDLVLVHGGGSFGHHHANTHGLSRTAGTHDAVAVREIHGAMKRLNDAVLEALSENGVPAVPVHPFSAARRDAEGTLDLPPSGIVTMLEEGFVPVLHGDVVVHAGKGATIVSGDELVVSIAERLDAERVGLCSAVPGVLDADGEVIPEIEGYDEVATYLGESESTDVTGGMAAKVRALLELEAPASVFGPDGLEGFLADEDPGTKIGTGH
jgi:isopentenyl phosphate kinase